MRNIDSVMKSKSDKIIYKLELLWHGWESDLIALVLEKTDGSRYLVMTNHGRPYVAKNQELNDRIKEYQLAISKTEEALNLLDGVSHD